MIKILIIDDDDGICHTLKILLRRLDLDVTSRGTINSGLNELKANPYDIVLLDVDLPDGNGLDAISKIKSNPSRPEVIIMTGVNDIDWAEIAIKKGVWDYLQKSDSPQNIILTLQRAVQYRKSHSHIHKPSKKPKSDGIVGNSSPLLACYDSALQAAESNANVLLTGETGTGKELFAKAIHNKSKRSGNHFVVVDCASLPQTLVESILFGHAKGAFTGAQFERKGLIAQAQGGTLFLDEVGELPLSLQKVLLRVIQEHRYRPVGAGNEESCDFRLISATNRDLDKMVSKKLFREDLLYRLRSITIQLPPLLMRYNDLQSLVLYYLDKKTKEEHLEKKGISPEFFEVLRQYHWPGNVRELFNVLDSTIAKAKQENILYPFHLPENIRAAAIKSSMACHKQEGIAPQLMPTSNGFPHAPDTFPPLKDYLLEIEKQYLEALLSKTGGDVRHVCRISGLSRSRIYDRLKKFNLHSNK